LLWSSYDYIWFPGPNKQEIFNLNLTVVAAITVFFIFQSMSEQQRLQGEVCRLEKEVVSLEQGKREFTDRKAAMEQALQSHDSVVAGLKQQIHKEETEKVRCLLLIFFLLCN
jgi:hypothetical protein